MRVVVVVVVVVAVGGGRKCGDRKYDTVPLFRKFHRCGTLYWPCTVLTARAPIPPQYFVWRRGVPVPLPFAQKVEYHGGNSLHLFSGLKPAETRKISYGTRFLPSFLKYHT
jgi:hypothetical protein